MIGAAISYIYVLVLLLIAPVFEKYGKEASRKFVHIMTSNWWFIVMIYFKRPFWPLVVSISFLVVNLITYKYSIFKSIERDGKDKSKGTIYYAITMILLVGISFYSENLYSGLVGCLVMGYADGLSAIIGKKLNWYPYYINGNKKSLSGSMAMLVITFIIVLAVSYIESGILCYETALGMALIATLLETISPAGTDNLTVPVGMAVFYLFTI